VRDHLNPSLAIKGAVLTMFDARTNLSAEVAAEVRAHLDSRVYDTVIPRSVRLSEAPSHGLPIHAYAPSSRGAIAYAELAAEIRRRDGRMDDVADARFNGSDAAGHAESRPAPDTKLSTPLREVAASAPVVVGAAAR
jgi:chromosome partitioning protein